MGRVFPRATVQETLPGSGRLDTQPLEVYAAEEMEESAEVSEDHDYRGIRAGLCASDMGTDESMAISDEEGGALRPEPRMVQEVWAVLPPGIFTIGSHTIGCGR